MSVADTVEAAVTLLTQPVGRAALVVFAVITGETLSLENRDALLSPMYGYAAPVVLLAHHSS